jgi:hypothetical protein
LGRNRDRRDRPHAGRRDAAAKRHRDSARCPRCCALRAVDAADRFGRRRRRSDGLWPVPSAGPTRRHVSSGAFSTLTFVYIVISVAEEIIWRGYAFDTLAPLRGPLVAVIATTVGFALAHGVHQGFVGVRFHVLTGLTFALTLLATRSLAAAAAAHATYNVTVFLRTVAIRKKASYDRFVVG